MREERNVIDKQRKAGMKRGRGERWGVQRGRMRGKNGEDVTARRYWLEMIGCSPQNLPPEIRFPLTHSP